MDSGTEFEVGEKVKWQGGKDSRPIISEGIFRNYDEDTGMCKIVVYLINGSPTHVLMSVKPELLERQTV